MARCFVCQVTAPDFEQLSDAYNNMIDYLGTLDTSDDIMSNILMFYEVVNEPLLNYTSAQDGYLALSYPLANPYNVSAAFVSTTIHSACSESVYRVKCWM